MPLDGSADTPGTPSNPEPGEGTVEAGQVTRRSLLTWLGRASVVGLFSPFIDACVRASGSSPTDRGGLADILAGTDTGFDVPGEPGGDEAAEVASRDPGAADTAAPDEAPDAVAETDEVAEAADVEDVEVVASPPCAFTTSAALTNPSARCAYTSSALASFSFFSAAASDFSENSCPASRNAFSRIARPIR